MFQYKFLSQYEELFQKFNLMFLFLLIQEFIQNNQLTVDQSVNETCITQMEKMVEGLKESYINEEKVHQSKVKGLTTNYNHILNQHERVLMAYR